ncbi:unnamed protein product, partial [Ascophyllum nodosum]
LRLGLVVLWVQSKDDPDEYAVYFNDMTRLYHIHRGQNTEGPVVNILLYNAKNPTDPDVFK